MIHLAPAPPRDRPGPAGRGGGRGLAAGAGGFAGDGAAQARRLSLDRRARTATSVRPGRCRRPAPSSSTRRTIRSSRAALSGRARAARGRALRQAGLARRRSPTTSRCASTSPARESGGVRAVAGRPGAKGRLESAAILLDASGLLDRADRARGRPADRPRDARRLRRRGRRSSPRRSRSICPATRPSAAADDAWTAAAAPTLDFRARPEVLGRLWVDEVARSAGGTASCARPGSAPRRRASRPSMPLSRRLAETSGDSATTVLLRAAARLYTAVEPEASPSRLRLLDVESGAIDAAAPAALRRAHRAFLPETDETLRVAWPPDGALGRRGRALSRRRACRRTSCSSPPATRAPIPLSGVARVDWVVAGSADGRPRRRGAGLRRRSRRTIPYRKPRGPRRVGTRRRRA